MNELAGVAAVTGLRLRFVGWDSYPDGEPCWDLQADTPWVGFIAAPSLDAAKRKAEALTGRTDWREADQVPPQWAAP